MNRSCRTSVTDCAAELRARAEKAWSYSAARAEALDEAASLVEALRSPAREDLAEQLTRRAAEYEREGAEAKDPRFAVAPLNRADAFREAAALARASAPSEARVDPDDYKRAERWIGDKIARYYDKGCDEEDDRDVAALRSVMDFVRAAPPDSGARVEMLDERIRRVFGILNDPEIPDNLARVMSRDKLRPLLRPAPPTLKGEDE